MLTAIYSARFKKELRNAIKGGMNIEKFREVSDLLLAGKQLLPKHRNHKLQGNFAGHWECHVQPDWLLIYQKTDSSIYFARTGSHSDLF